ncbi:MAG: SBBP repeat-containing protein [Ferruginibacter sp.]
MQNFIRSILFLFFFGVMLMSKAQVLPANQQLGKKEFLFMENKGQLRKDVLFTADRGSMKIFITTTGIHYQFNKTEYPQGFEATRLSDPRNMTRQIELQQQVKQSTVHFMLGLKKSNPRPVVRKEKQSLYTENYYLEGNKISGVHGYEKIVLENVYPHIDWIIYVSNGCMKYDFLIHAGGNANDIQLQVKDADKVNVTKEGALLIETSLGSVQEKTPVSYDENEKIIATHFKQCADGIIRFSVAAHHGRILRIDPSISWATYYGDVNGDQTYACAKDPGGNVFIAGYTNSAANIAAGGYQNTLNGSSDAFLVKFNSSGIRVWSTYFGGNSYEYCYACTVDFAGNVYIGGQTASTTGIASGGFQNTYYGGTTDAYLAKFTNSGSLIWSTYYGGNSDEGIYGCVTDVTGNVYISGSTASSVNIASGGIQNNFSGVFDVFLVKFNSAGSRLWATYYGSNGVDYCNASCIDNNGYIYIAGQTTSTTNISNGGFQNSFGGSSDAYIAKFDGNGARLWATYYGGTANDNGKSCAVDVSGNVYLAGQTSSTTNISLNGFQNTAGGATDGFLVKFDNTGFRLWATYFGGIGDETGNSCAVDGSGNIFLIGSTNNSASGIANGGFQNASGGGFDAFVLKLSSLGTELWASYYGGSGDDVGSACVTDGSNLYVTGNTKSSAGIASATGFQTTFGGLQDAYLAKIDDAATIVSIANGNWNDPAVWTGGLVPSNTSVVIVNHNIMVTANAGCYSVTVNATGAVTVKTGSVLSVLH